MAGGGGASGDRADLGCPGRDTPPLRCSRRMGGVGMCAAWAGRRRRLFGVRCRVLARTGPGGRRGDKAVAQVCPNGATRRSGVAVVPVRRGRWSASCPGVGGAELPSTAAPGGGRDSRRAGAGSVLYRSRRSLGLSGRRCRRAATSLCRASGLGFASDDRTRGVAWSSASLAAERPDGSGGAVVGAGEIACGVGWNTCVAGSAGREWSRRCSASARPSSAPPRFVAGPRLVGRGDQVSAVARARARRRALRLRRRRTRGAQWAKAQADPVVRVRSAGAEPESVTRDCGDLAAPPRRPFCSPGSLARPFPPPLGGCHPLGGKPRSAAGACVCVAGRRTVCPGGSGVGGGGSGCVRAARGGGGVLLRVGPGRPSGRPRTRWLRVAVAVVYWAAGYPPGSHRPPGSAARVVPGRAHGYRPGPARPRGAASRTACARDRVWLSAAGAVGPGGARAVRGAWPGRSSCGGHERT